MDKNQGFANLAQFQPHGALNFRIQMVFKATGQAINAPSFPIPPGASVSLRTVNGANVNTYMCSIGDYPEQLDTTSAQILPPGADVQVPWACENLCEIWASGTAGDGLLISVQQGAVG